MNKLKGILSSISFYITSLLLPTSCFAAFSSSYCELNGKEVPCDQLWADYGRYLSLFMGVLVLLFVFAIIFWFWMIIDCLSRDLTNKMLWLLALIFFGLPAAIIYYVMIKRSAPNFNPAVSTYNPPPPTQPTDSNTHE